MTSKKAPVTARQAEVLTTLKNFVERKGYPPTHSELAAELGLNSGQSLRKHLLVLVKKGYLAHQYNQTRSYRVLTSERPLNIRGGRPNLVGASKASGAEYGRRSGTRRQAIAARKKELIVLMKDALASKNCKPLRRHVAEFIVLTTAPELWQPEKAKGG